MHCTIYENYVVYWFSRDICLIGGVGGISLPWHSTICETALVYWSAMGIICIVHYVRLMGCNSVAYILGQFAGGRCNGLAWIYGQLAGEGLRV